MNSLPNDDLTLGEIGRALVRIEASVSDLRADVQQRSHKLTGELQLALGPIAAHGIQIEHQQKAIEILDRKIDDVTASANKIAGAGAILAFLSSLAPWPWKR